MSGFQDLQGFADMLCDFFHRRGAAVLIVRGPDRQGIVKTHGEVAGLLYRGAILRFPCKAQGINPGVTDLFRPVFLVLHLSRQAAVGAGQKFVIRFLNLRVCVIEVFAPILQAENLHTDVGRGGRSSILRCEKGQPQFIAGIFMLFPVCGNFIGQIGVLISLRFPGGLGLVRRDFL